MNLILLILGPENGKGREIRRRVQAVDSWYISEDKSFLMFDT